MKLSLPRTSYKWEFRYPDWYYPVVRTRKHYQTTSYWGNWELLIWIRFFWVRVNVGRSGTSISIHKRYRSAKA